MTTPDDLNLDEQWEQARRVVEHAIGDDWDATFDELPFCVAPWGFYDDDAFLIPCGPRQYFEDGKTELALNHQWVCLVDRQTGQYFQIEFDDVPAHLPRFEAMTPIGTGGPTEDPLGFIFGRPLN